MSILFNFVFLCMKPEIQLVLNKYLLNGMKNTKMILARNLTYRKRNK